MQIRILVLAAAFGILGQPLVHATEPDAPELSLAVSNGQKRLQWLLYPGVQQYNVLSSTSVTGPFAIDTSGNLGGGIWTASNALAQQYFRLGVTPLSSNALLNTTLLNRLAYGPTPDELERVTTLTPQGYINEQLAPETITTGLPDVYTSLPVETNSATVPPPGWVSTSVTGTFSNLKLYVYLTTVGDVYLDDIVLQPIYYSNVVSMVGTNLVTNSVAFYGTNIVRNGNFEIPLTPTWTVSGNMAQSQIVPSPVPGGGNCLHMISTSPGTTEASSIWQNTISAGLSSTTPMRLTYNYLPGPDSSRLVLRLSQNGIYSSADDPPTTPKWFYATATGNAGSKPFLYIYLSDGGGAYVDDVKLFAGSVAGSGPNLLVNGDFESTPLTDNWLLTGNHSASLITSNAARSGANALQLVSSGAGGSEENSVYQSNSNLVNGQTFTVSYWYVPAANGATLTVRLSGSALASTPDVLPTISHYRLDNGAARISDLRSWFCYNAVASPRQLHEVLSQFLENHFVTQYSKSQDYFANVANNTGNSGRWAADLEYREMTKWRNKMLDPNCTFHDLLRISAESPAMIIYLDTVNSKGQTELAGNPPTLRTNIANENYARELLELFCNGVDNGYDQRDIVQLSRCWTGWSVELVEPENVNNPFAPASLTHYPGVSSNAKSNVVGVWAFNYKQANHNTNNKYLFFNWDAAGVNRTGPKSVPARFGAPWAGRNYSLTLTNVTGTNGIRDGYIVVQQMANLPFTMEYLCVKLCRLFVHDEFPNPTTRLELPEYAFYDYTNPNRSAEAELVRQCMLAWENSSPKGNIRAVLNTIFNSHLFRTQCANAQKVKTPLEFCVSAIRALRSANPNGTYTANTDGNINSPLGRMGTMSLFNRAEPNGYPEDGAPWISAGTLAERTRYVQSLLLAGSGDDAGNATTDPVGLLRKKIPASLNNAASVVDYVLSILYPGEGTANLAQYRAMAITYLNTADNGTGAASSFSSLGNTTTAYDTRVRGMVSYLMTLPRFQEQ